MYKLNNNNNKKKKRKKSCTQLNIANKNTIYYGR